MMKIIRSSRPLNTHDVIGIIVAIIMGVVVLGGMGAVMVYFHESSKIEKTIIEGVKVDIEKRPAVPVELLATLGYSEDQVRKNCNFKFVVQRDVKAALDRKFNNYTVMSYNRSLRPGTLTIIYCGDKAEVMNFLEEVLK
jgi:hypothetical protein